MNHYEIEASAKRAKAGSQEDLLKLINQFKPYLCKYVGVYRIRGYETADMMQVGYLSLINAVKKYKPGSNTFICYAAHTIRNNFKYYYRTNAKLDSELSLNAPIAADGSSTAEFIDFTSYDDEMEEKVIDSVLIDDMRNIIQLLPDDEIELLHTVYYKKCSLQKYALKSGITYLEAIRKKKLILDKLHHFL